MIDSKFLVDVQEEALKNSASLKFKLRIAVSLMKSGKVFFCFQRGRPSLSGDSTQETTHEKRRRMALM